MNKKIWILVIVVAIIVVIYFIVKKNKTTEIPNAVTNFVNNSGLGNIISSPNSSTSTTTTPIIKINGFDFGDKLYAATSAVNIYKTANAGSSNLASFKAYGKDEFIGTYLGKESIYTKILIQSPASSVYVLTNQIYSK